MTPFLTGCLAGVILGGAVLAAVYPLRRLLILVHRSRRGNKTP